LPKCRLLITWLVFSGRYLTCALPGEYKTLAIRLMDFRTKNLAENLYYPDNLLSAERADAIFHRKEQLLIARFPLPLSLSFQPASAIESPGYIKLFSMDKLVQLSIPYHLQFFKVTFPIKVPETDPTDKSLLSYTSITQIHPTQDPPRYWVYPILLAFQSLRQSEDHQYMYEDLEYLISRLTHLSLQYRLLDTKRVSMMSTYDNPHEQDIQDATEFDLMPDVVRTLHHLTLRLPHFNHHESLPSHASNTNFRGHSDLNGFAKADAIRAFECDLGCFRAIIVNRDTVEIQIILSDETVIQTMADFKFLRLWPAGSWKEEMLLVDMVMHLMGPYTNHHTGASYPLREIVTLALSLYQNAHSNMLAYFSDPVTDSSSLPTPTSIKGGTPYSSFSSAIKSSINIPDVGEFVYYADGRCKCRFVDRTIIELPKSLNGELASILDQSGANFKVRISNPVGFEEHIAAMIEFIDFVTQSHEEKTRVAQTKQKELDILAIQKAKSLEHREKLANVLQTTL
jgi:hypothetical protein